MTKLRTSRFPRLLLSGLLLGILSGCDLGKPAQPTGKVLIQTQPEGALITFDDHAPEAGPLTVNAVANGKHLIIVRKEGFREARRSVTLLDGEETAVEIPLEPLRGLVLINSKPPGADVEINGAFLGKTPLYTADFPLGPHRIKFSSPGFTDKEVLVDVKDREPQSIFADLLSDSGTLMVDSSPSGAEVLVDGRAVGNTPVNVPRLARGPHDILIRLDGFRDYRHNVRIEASETERLNARLDAIPGSLKIVSMPDKARIYIDNSFRGETTLELRDLTPGSYLIRAEKRGYAEETRTVVVKNGGQAIEEIRMVKNSGSLLVITEPSGVQVVIDSEPCGVTLSGASNVLSKPLRVDMLSQGDHTLQLVKAGYHFLPVKFRIVEGKTTNLHEKLVRRFIPDTIVRIGEGSDQAIKGVLLRKHPNGDVIIEVRPGIERVIRASEILSITPLTTGP